MSAFSHNRTFGAPPRSCLSLLSTPFPRLFKFAGPYAAPRRLRPLLGAGIVTTEIDVGDGPAVRDQPLSQILASNGAFGDHAPVAIGDALMAGDALADDPTSSNLRRSHGKCRNHLLFDVTV